MDRGPGLDIQRCLQDGYSSGGSPGTGLGAIRRLAGSFDIYSIAQQGTIVWAKFNKNNLNALPPEQVHWAGISVPAPGEEECGDAWATHIDANAFRIVVSDGLGHGHDAAMVSAQVISEFQNAGAMTTWHAKSFLERTHAALTGTRGAAVAAGQILHASDRFQFAGIGNISASILTPESTKGLMSHNGTLGARIRTIQAMEYEWPRNAWLVLHSDGLISRWSDTPYPGILTRHPIMLAAVLVRDYTRGRDDVTVVVVRRR